jgi:hypothetical protein
VYEESEHFLITIKWMIINNWPPQRHPNSVRSQYWSPPKWNRFVCIHERARESPWLHASMPDSSCRLGPMLLHTKWLTDVEQQMPHFFCSALTEAMVDHKQREGWKPPDRQNMKCHFNRREFQIHWGPRNSNIFLHRVDLIECTSIDNSWQEIGISFWALRNHDEQRSNSIGDYRRNLVFLKVVFWSSDNDICEKRRLWYQAIEYDIKLPGPL